MHEVESTILCFKANFIDKFRKIVMKKFVEIIEKASSSYERIILMTDNISEWENQFGFVKK
jgi:hypothetical protein